MERVMERLSSALKAKSDRIIFFIYEVAVLLWMGIVYSQTSVCPPTSNQKKYFLLFNIVLYTLLVLVSIFIHIRTWCAAPSEKEVEEGLLAEEKKAAAVRDGNTMV